MAAKALKPDGQDKGKPGPLVYIQQKLERLLGNPKSPAAPFHDEVESIVDMLDSMNRDSHVLRRGLRLGDKDFD